ncbi:tyrosine-type recombinase/integrase [Tsuneonella sp. HG249]
MDTDYTLGKLTRRRTDGSKYWSYCIIWRDEAGDRKRYSLGTTDRVAAEAQARRVWAGFGSKRTYETVGDLVTAYLDSLGGKLQEKRKREAWVAAKSYWATLKPAVIDEGVSLAYPAWRKRSVNTVRQELSLIRTALNWSVNAKHLDKAPKITLPAMPETSVGHLTKAEFRKLLDGCERAHVRLFCMLGVTTGGRKSAILQAKWKQVNFERALIDLNEEGRVQNSKFRATVPLNDLILPALREAKEAALTEYIIEHNGKPLLDIKKGFAAAAARAGLDAHPHMLRHSAAVWMAEDRVPMPEIAQFLGHREISVTTRVYARFHPDYLRQAAGSLRWC